MYLIQLKILSVLLFFSVEAHSQLTIDGTYTGKNLYIQNPESGDLAGEYCATSVTVNGQALPDSVVNSNAFEIPLNSMGLQDGDAVHIVIHHHDGCKPKILQPMICRTSQELAEKAETTISYDKKQRTFLFSEPVDYIIYNAAGDPVQEGHGTSFKAKSLPKGHYTVGFEEQGRRIVIGRKEGIPDRINCFKSVP